MNKTQANSDFRRIPRLSHHKHELLSAAKPRESREILQPFHDSFLLTHSKDTWRVTAVQLVNNPELRQRFRDRKNAMKTEIAQSRLGAPTKCELPESHAFLICEDVIAACREGVHATSTSCNLLGNSLMGVHMFRHADMCLEAFWRGLGSPPICWVQLVVCKILLGRLKRVVPNDAGGFPLEPTPNCHCHVPSQCARPTDTATVAIQRSQVYIYEYDDENLPSSTPRQCLPIALVSVQRIYKPTRDQSVLSYSRLPKPASRVAYANNATPSDAMIEQAVKAQREAKIASRDASHMSVTQEDIDCLMNSIAGGDARQVAVVKKRACNPFDSASDDTVKDVTISCTTRKNRGDDNENRTAASKSPSSREVTDDVISISQLSSSQDDSTIVINREPGISQQARVTKPITDATKCWNVDHRETSEEFHSEDSVNDKTNSSSNDSGKTHDVDQLLMEKLEQLEVHITDNMAKLRELTALRRRQPGGPVVSEQVIQAEEETNRKLHQALQGCLEHQARLIREFSVEKGPVSKETTPVIEGTSSALPITVSDSDVCSLSQIDCALDITENEKNRDHGNNDNNHDSTGCGDENVEEEEDTDEEEDNKICACLVPNEKWAEKECIDDFSNNTGDEKTHNNIPDYFSRNSIIEPTDEQFQKSHDFDEIDGNRTNDQGDSSRLARELFERLDSRLSRLYRDYNSAYWAWCEMKGVRDLHARAGVRMARADRQELRSQQATLASLHVDIERYARHLASSSRLLSNSSSNRPTSAWQRAELAAIDAHLRAVDDTRQEVVKQLQARRRRLLAHVTLPRLPENSPGNDPRQLLRMLSGPLKPAKKAYVEEKLRILLRNKQPEDATTMSPGDDGGNDGGGGGEEAVA